MPEDRIVIIGHSDLRTYGCPHCGCCCSVTLANNLAGQGCVYTCDHCGSQFAVSDDVKSLKDIIKQDCLLNLIHEHPRAGKSCQQCNYDRAGNASCEPIQATACDTPGCFCCGGQFTKRQSLVIELPCPRSAKHIASLFCNGSVVADGRSIIVGACLIHQPNLYSLFLGTIRNKSIGSELIVQSQRLAVPPSLLHVMEAS